MEYLKDALKKLSAMLEVLDCFDGTQSHRLVENQDHVRRIFDCLLSSTSFEVFQLILSNQDTNQGSYQGYNFQNADTSIL